MCKEQVIKFDERLPFHKVAKWYQERLIKFSDIDHTKITNERARTFALGSMCRVPAFLQCGLLDDMEKIGLIKRDSKQIIHILPV